MRKQSKRSKICFFMSHFLMIVLQYFLASFHCFYQSTKHQSCPDFCCCVHNPSSISVKKIDALAREERDASVKTESLELLARALTKGYSPLAYTYHVPPPSSFKNCLNLYEHVLNNERGLFVLWIRGHYHCV